MVWPLHAAPDIATPCAPLPPQQLTDVSLGMILFHLALLDAARSARGPKRDYRAPKWCSALMAAFVPLWVSGLGYRPMLCYTGEVGRVHMRGNGLPRDAVDAAIKVFVPMPRTSFESWPCSPSDGLFSPTLDEATMDEIQRGWRPTRITKVRQPRAHPARTPYALCTLISRPRSSPAPALPTHLE